MDNSAIEAQLYNQIPGEIFCVFKTNLPDHLKIDEDPIQVQTNLTEKALSDLIVQILRDNQGEQISQNTRFEFLIDKEFLRGNLKSHILKHQLKTEEIIEIHYCQAISQPKVQDQKQEEDWISSIETLNYFEQSDYVVSLYNGSISYYDQNNQLQVRQKICDKSIKQIKVTENFLRKGEENQYIIYSACSDEFLRVAHLDLNNNTIQEEFRGEGAEASLESVDIHPLQNNQACTGTYDGYLIFWKVSKEYIEDSSAHSEAESNKKKRVKLSQKKLSHQAKSKVHNDNVSKLVWATENTVISGSLDHSIKMYDTHKQLEKQSINCKDNAITALNYSDQIIYSGQEDGYVKLYDTRVQDKLAQTNYKSHTIWVSDIKQHPLNDQLFATCAYDNLVKIWDKRSSYPLFSLKSHKDRLLALQWNGDNQIISGGSDSKLFIHNFN